MKSEDYQGILNQYLIIDQDDKPYVTLKGVELVLKMHETEVKKLHKPNVSSRLSLEELIWQKQNPDEPYNADDFYDWAAENSKQALDFAFDIYRELGR